MFTRRSSCLEFVDMHYRLCNGSARIEYLSVFLPRKVRIRAVFNKTLKLQKQPQSLVVVGTGVHYDMHFSRVKNDFVLPLLRALASS